MKTIEEAIQSVKDFNWKNSTQEDIESALPTFGMNDEQLFEIPKEFEPYTCLLYTSPSPRDRQKSRMPSSA